MHAMMTTDIPASLDEAELSDWPHLLVHCPTCRTARLLFVAHLRACYGNVRLDDVVQRLRCSRCGGAPTRVQLERPSRTGGVTIATLELSDLAPELSPGEGLADR
jgi:hypothetical protein